MDLGLTGLSGGSLFGPATSDTYFQRLFEMPAGGGTVTEVLMRLKADTVSGAMQAIVFNTNGSPAPNVLQESEISAGGLVTSTENWYSVVLGTPVHFNGGVKFYAGGRASVDYLMRYQTGGLTNEFAQRWGEGYSGIQTPDTNSGNFYIGTEVPWIYVKYTPDANSTIKGLSTIQGLQSIQF